MSTCTIRRRALLRGITVGGSARWGRVTRAAGRALLGGTVPRDTPAASRLAAAPPDHHAPLSPVYTLHFDGLPCRRLRRPSVRVRQGRGAGEASAPCGAAPALLTHHSTPTLPLPPLPSYDIGITGGVTSMPPFLQTFFPAVFAQTAAPHVDSPYCKAQTGHGLGGVGGGGGGVGGLGGVGPGLGLGALRGGPTHETTVPLPLSPPLPCSTTRRRCSCSRRPSSSLAWWRRSSPPASPGPTAVAPRCWRRVPASWRGRG